MVVILGGIRSVIKCRFRHGTAYVRPVPWTPHSCSNYGCVRVRRTEFSRAALSWKYSLSRQRWPSVDRRYPQHNAQSARRSDALGRRHCLGRTASLLYGPRGQNQSTERQERGQRGSQGTRRTRSNGKRREYLFCHTMQTGDETFRWESWLLGNPCLCFCKSFIIFQFECCLD